MGDEGGGHHVMDWQVGEVQQVYGCNGCDITDERAGDTGRRGQSGELVWPPHTC